MCGIMLPMLLGASAIIAGGPTETERLHGQMESSLANHPALHDLASAPPVPVWPEWLPDPIAVVVDGAEGLFFPSPSDYALMFHLAWWQRYPGKAQLRINEAYHKYEDLELEFEGAFAFDPEPTGWPAWQVVLATVGSAIAAAIVAGGVGYLFGRAQP